MATFPQNKQQKSLLSLTTMIIITEVKSGWNVMLSLVESQCLQSPKSVSKSPIVNPQNALKEGQHTQWVYWKAKKRLKIKRFIISESNVAAWRYEADVWLGHYDRVEEVWSLYFDFHSVALEKASRFNHLPLKKETEKKVFNVTGNVNLAMTPALPLQQKTNRNVTKNEADDNDLCTCTAFLIDTDSVLNFLGKSTVFVARSDL